MTIENYLDLKGKAWLSIFASSLAFAVAAAMANEMLLRAGNHRPSLADDLDLWCLHRETIDSDNSKETWVLIGASRIQTNVDTPTMRRELGGNKCIQLANSGSASGFPVVEDIAFTTSFAGTLLISETEVWLTEPAHKQAKYVEYYHREWSWSSRLNRILSTKLEQSFVFFSPQSSSLRLWGNLISKRRLPLPAYGIVNADRQIFCDFSDPAVLANLQALLDIRDRDGKTADVADNTRQHNPVDPASHAERWSQEVVSRWKPAISRIQGRGGRVIFIRMPESPDRRERIVKMFPPDQYWYDAMAKLNAESYHLMDHANWDVFKKFQLPDKSHVDQRDAPRFTRSMLQLISAQTTDK